jgi:hypothetical protein
MRAGLQTPCTAFKGPRCIAAGELADVALKAKTAVDKGEQVLIFDDTTSESIEVDFRGSAEDVLRWLNAQPGGASVALRKLVEEARRANGGKDRVRQSQEATYRFMSIMAGNRPGFEEAMRALFAGHRDRFDQLIAPWPKDVRHHARKLAADALDAQAPQRGS